MCLTVFYTESICQVSWTGALVTFQIKNIWSKRLWLRLNQFTNGVSEMGLWCKLMERKPYPQVHRTTIIYILGFMCNYQWWWFLPRFSLLSSVYNSDIFPLQRDRLRTRLCTKEEITSEFVLFCSFLDSFFFWEILYCCFFLVRL